MIRPSPASAIGLRLRGLAFRGRRFECPCCKWRIRSFTQGGGSFRRRPSGYCPRCNSKARHRRIWLHLQRSTDLFTRPQVVLEVAPHISMARGLTATREITYVAFALESAPYLEMLGDLTSTPIRAESIDALICIHVLEHVEDDKAAMAEIYRILKPGGWALVSAPIDFGRVTYEDATIVTPTARRTAFGEAGHVRVYGYDIVDRLTDTGFDVIVDKAEDIAAADADRYGLLFDENLVMCRKGE